MPLHHDPGDERAAQHVRPPSKRARVNPRSRLGSMASRTNSTKEGASSGCTSTSSSKHASTLSPPHGLREAGGQKPSASVADRIYDLSSELGVLRSRSVEALRLLRSTAQGVSELEEALRPVLVAVEADLARCHQADLEAIFGRSAVPKGAIGCPPAAEKGNDCGSALGGTAAAVNRLDRVISVLHRDVAVAGMLADQGERLRVIARWVRRAIATTTAQPSVASGARDNEVGTDQASLGRNAACASRSSDMIDEPRSTISDDKHWTLRVFQQSDTGSDRFGKSGVGALRRGHNRFIRLATSDNTCNSRYPFVGNSGRADGRELRGWPIVAVQALRTTLPSLEPAQADKPASLTMREGDVGGEARAPPCSPTKNVGRAWRFPFSWLIGGSGQNDAVANATAPGSPSIPPSSSPLVLPRITVCVIYVGRIHDMARLARTEERGLASEGRGGAADAGSASTEAAGNEVFSRPTTTVTDSVAAGESDGSVKLIRSEVRVAFVHPGPAEPSLQGGREALRAEMEHGSRSLPDTAVRLQIALQLRTRSPVAVVRLVHRGGHLLPERSPAEAVPSSPPPRPVPGLFSPSKVSSAARVLPPGPANGHSSNGNGGTDGEGGVGCGYRAVSGASFGASTGLSDGDNLSGVGGSNITGGGKDGRDSSYYDEGANDDVAPSGFANAPEELRLPRGDDAGGCELKIGTDHILGMNVMLPPDQLLPSGNRTRVRPRRRPRPLTPFDQREPHKPAHEATSEVGGTEGSRTRPRHDDGGTSDDERRSRLAAAGGHGRGSTSTSKKRPRTEDWIGNDEDFLQEKKAAKRSIDEGRNRAASDRPARELKLGGGRGNERAPGHQERAPGALDARGAHAGRNEGYDGSGSSREAKSRTGNTDGKTGWGWGFFLPWRRKRDDCPDYLPASSPSFPNQHQQNLRFKQDASRPHGREEGRGVQSHGMTFERPGSGVFNVDRIANAPPPLSRPARANGQGSAEPGEEPAGVSGCPENGTPLLVKRREPLIVTVVLRPPVAGTLL